MVTARTWKVGDTVFWVPRDPRHRSQARELRITKVGRVWLTLEDNRRIDIKTLLMDAEGQGYADQCYLTRDDWMLERARQSSWGSLRHVLHRSGPPAHVTAEWLDSVIDFITAKLPQNLPPTTTYKDT
jgi:hypothetical protein